jgi:hypothetical protein
MRPPDWELLGCGEETRFGIDQGMKHVRDKRNARIGNRNIPWSRVRSVGISLRNVYDEFKNSALVVSSMDKQCSVPDIELRS